MFIAAAQASEQLHNYRITNIDENNIDLFLTLLYQHNSTVYNEQMNRSMRCSGLTALKFTDLY